MNPTGKLLIVPEFFAIGTAQTAFLLYAVKGGGLIPHIYVRQLCTFD